MDSTEEERVEALRDWWKANGRTLLIGIGLAIGSYAGFQSWQNIQANKAEAASTLYTELQAAILASETEQASRLGDEILTQYGSGAYGPVTALLLAKLAAERNDASVITHLNWVLEHSDEVALQTIAHLRLARWQLGQNDTEAARQQLDSIAEDERNASWHELEGDLFTSQGELPAARLAYSQALLSGATVRLGSLDLVQMKLDDLGPAPKEEDDAP